MGVEKFWTTRMSKESINPPSRDEGLIWVMSFLKEFHCTVVHIETDYSDLVELDSPADWSAFASELVSFCLLKDGFSEFNIPRISMTRSLHADSLLKEAKNNGTLFPI